MFSLLSYDTINMINESRMTDYIQSEVALTETQNKWMADTLGSLWFLTCAFAKYKLSLLSHA